MAAIVFAVLAGLFWGIGELCAKSVLKSHEVGPMTAIAVRSVVALPVLLLAFVAASRGWLESVGISAAREPTTWVHASSPVMWKLILGAGVSAGAFGVLFFYLGLSAGDRAAWAAALDAPDPSAAQATAAQATAAQATTAQATTAQATTAQATAAKKQKFATTMGSDFVPSPFAGPAWAAAQAKAAAQAAGDGAAKSTSTDALPFQRSAGAAATPPAQAVAPTTAPPVTSGGLPFQRVAPPAAAPPAAQARPAGPRLTVEQLAWLQAQIETSAELGRAARDSLGLNDAEYAAERAFWQGRFQQDRAAVERYSQLFYHYRRPR